MNRALAVAIGLAALGLGAPGSAFAKPKVAIVAIDGDKGSTLQEVITDLLDGDVSVVGSSKVSRALDKLELDPAELTSKKLKKLAKELEADSIIRGELSAKGSHKVLHLKLFVNGKRVKGFTIEFGSAKSKKFKEALHDKLVEKLGVEAEEEAKPAEEEAKPAEEETKPAEDEADKAKKKKKKKKGGDSEEEATSGEGETASSGDEGAATGDDNEDPNAGKKKKKKKTASADETEGEVEGGVEGDGPGVAEPSGRTANRAGVRADFGPSMSARTLTFSSRQFEEAPKPYQNSPVPGGRVAFELFPLAISKPYGALSGLGIGGEFDQTLSLNVQSTVQQGTKFPVTQKHFNIGARLRLVIGKKPTSPSVTLGLGYTNRTFKVDRTALMEGNVIDLPDVGYKGYNAGIAGRFGVTPAIAILAGARGIFVTTTGAIQTANEYGQAKVTGAEGNLGVDVGIGKRMAVQAVFEVTQMGFAFTGTGQMAINRDGDPATKDVGGAADRYIGGALTFGVFY